MVQLALCGVGFWDRAKALALIERGRERIEQGVSLVAKTGVDADGTEAVERVSSIISSRSSPTVWFKC